MKPQPAPRGYFFGALYVYVYVYAKTWGIASGYVAYKVRLPRPDLAVAPLEHMLVQSLRRFLQKGDSVFVSTVGRHFKGYYSKLAKLHHCILWAHIAIENDPFVDVLPVISMIIFHTQITRSYAAYHFYSHIHGQPWVNPV